MKRADEGISIITPTIRKENIHRIISNFCNQKFPCKELIIVLNNDDICKDEIMSKVAMDKRIRVVQLSQDRMLGSCLNLGIELAKYENIAKFDDDDYYAANYLMEAYKALKENRGDIVSKRSIFMYFMASGELITRYPIVEKQLCFRGAGATIFTTKNIWEKVKFNDLEVGTDTDFFSRCKKKGLRNYVTSMYNYLCIRNRDVTKHTWQTTEEDIKRAKEYTGQIITIANAYKYVSKNI